MKTECPHLCAIVNQDGAAILNSTAGTITTLNSTGAFVWQGLQRGEDVGVLTQNLVQETGGDPDTIRQDLLEFIDTMKAGKILAH